ncbi:hypothetical protein [Pseudoduganella namucuonensis]|uniref:hypothetical protein n=1 Tax=Pseudoduganella namucuonensis TaxID=1035707 RepID=UPI001160C82B|nr:hypothetical protein [Pseudoduganella namucuonensis]
MNQSAGLISRQQRRLFYCAAGGPESEKPTSVHPWAFYYRSLAARGGIEPPVQIVPTLAVHRQSVATARQGALDLARPG